MFPSPRCPRAGQSGLWQNWACGSNGDPPGARFGTMLGGMLGGPALFKPQPPSPRFLGVLPALLLSGKNRDIRLRINPLSAGANYLRICNLLSGKDLSCLVHYERLS